MQNKLLDLTCTHANTLHATDCKDCIQLVNDITQLFIDEGWRVPQKPLDHKKAEERLGVIKEFQHPYLCNKHIRKILSLLNIEYRDDGDYR